MHESYIHIFMIISDQNNLARSSFEKGPNISTFQVVRTNVDFEALHVLARWLVGCVSMGRGRRSIRRTCAIASFATSRRTQPALARKKNQEWIRDMCVGACFFARCVWEEVKVPAASAWLHAARSLVRGAHIVTVMLSSSSPCIHLSAACKWSHYCIHVA